MAAVGGGGLCRLCGGSREAGEETRLHLSFHLRTPHGCKPSWEWALCAPSFRHHCLPLPAPTPLHTPPLVPRLQGIRRPSLPDSFGIKKNLAAHEVGAFAWLFVFYRAGAALVRNHAAAAPLPNAHLPTQS